MQNIPQHVIDKLRTNQKVVILTGAGVSKESGIPTFREVQTGLWQNYDPKELATPEAFQRNPKLVWEWYDWRRELITHSQPNNGHYAIATMEKYLSELTLITQNVDGMHQRAGSSNVIELHGNIFRNICFTEGIAIDQVEDCSSKIPICPRCGSFLRPDVIWFGEQLPQKALDQAFQVSSQADIFFVVGTAGVVQPAASIPFAAIEAGAVTVEINPEKTPLSGHVNYFIPGKAGKILPRIINLVWNEVVP